MNKSTFFAGVEMNIKGVGMITPQRVILFYLFLEDFSYYNIYVYVYMYIVV